VTGWVAVPAVLVHVRVYVVAAASVTTCAPPLVVTAMFWSIEHAGAGVGALAYVHENATVVGTPIVTEPGDATNVPIMGATGTGVAPRLSVRVVVPAELVQVSVYEVAVVIVTLVVAPAVTGPTPWLIEHAGAGTGVVANVHVHVMSDGTPISAAVGVAANPASAGATGWSTWTTSCAVSAPTTLVQVRVYAVDARRVRVTVVPLVMAPMPLSIEQLGAGDGSTA